MGHASLLSQDPELKQKTCSHARANKDLEQRNESGNESKVETSWLTQCLRLRCTVLHPVLLQTPPFYQQVTSKNGHYILLYGVDSDGLIRLNDPYSETRSQKTYALDLIIKEVKTESAFLELEPESAFFRLF